MVYFWFYILYQWKQNLERQQPRYALISSMIFKEIVQLSDDEIDKYEREK